MKPRYLKTHDQGLLHQKVQAAGDALRECRLCPRKCNVDRLKNDPRGVCKTGESAVVASFHSHHGEEAPLVGRNGSGTIFFTHCNLNCCFCQNYDISHQGAGREVTSTELAAMMMELQHAGCHNINFVSPSHVVPQILSALEIAVDQGLQIPLVYNTGGYDRVKTLKHLEGCVDIYMPDFKFWSSEVSALTCQAPDYPEICRRAIKEMHRQVGDLIIDDNGIAQQGLLVRHLVMPGNSAGTRDIMNYIATKISRQTYVNVMGQYRPCGRAHEIDGLNRRISLSEFRQAVRDAREEGLTRLD
jgi:putative pyruvate formate lyase activating enzyme